MDSLLHALPGKPLWQVAKNNSYSVQRQFFRNYFNLQESDADILLPLDRRPSLPGDGRAQGPVLGRHRACIRR